MLRVPIVERVPADDGVRIIEKRRRRHETRFEGGAVRVDLERGSHAPPPQSVYACQVDLAANRNVVVVGAADHGENLAIVRIHDEHRARVHRAGAIALYARLHPLVRRRLRAEVQRGRDREPALIQRGRTVALQQVLLHVVGEMRGQRARRQRGCLVRGDHLLEQVAAIEILGLAAAEVTNRHHSVQHLPPALLHRLQLVRRAERVVERRRLREPREERRLRPAQVGRVHAEVHLGRRLRAPRAVAVVDGVEVELEDLLLRVAPLHLLGEDQLAELATDGSALRLGRVENIVLDHLLRDRRAPERRRVMREVVDDRDEQAPVVDA